MSSDPTTRYARPDQQEPQKQEHPGHSGAMNPEPDYGEKTYRGSGKLTGKRALITGGDSGIGRAVALAFAREGADVMISHLEAEEQDARETCRLVGTPAVRRHRWPATSRTRTTAAGSSTEPSWTSAD